MAKKNRRAKGDGMVRQRSDGRWEARTKVEDPVTGTTKTKTFYAGSQKEVLQKRDDYLTAVKTATYVEPRKGTFGEWAGRWLELYVKPKVRQSTFTKYQINYRTHVLPGLGEIELQRLTTDQIQAFYNELAEDHSSSVVAIVHQIINGSLRQAVRQRVILDNPAQYTVRLPVRYKEVDPLTPEETATFMEAIKDDRLYPAFLLCLFAGLRRSEAAALHWDCVDLKAGTVTVREGLTRVETSQGKTELLFDEPKTASGKRTVPLLPFVVQELKAHRARQNEEKLKLGNTYRDHNLVFCSPCGDPIDPGTLLKKLKKAAKRAGLRGEIRVHTLRHTFGNTIGQSGENPENLQKLMGHSDIQTTLGTYCHSNMEDKRRAVGKLESLLGAVRK